MSVHRNGGFGGWKIVCRETLLNLGLEVRIFELSMNGSVGAMS